MGMHKYRDLKIWQRSMDFVEKVYDVSATFPDEEKYGLVAQLRRCSVSVPSNIAEGAGRGTDSQFKRFLEFSMGSINEAQTQLELAYRFGYLEKQHIESLLEEALQIYKMILSFYNGLKN